MPDCYAAVNMNPRDPSYAQEVANAIAEAVGVRPDRVIIRFDEVRKKAHVFVPLKDEGDFGAAVARLKELEAILDYGLVARPSEVGLPSDDYPSSAETA